MSVAPLVVLALLRLNLSDPLCTTVARCFNLPEAVTNDPAILAYLLRGVPASGLLAARSRPFLAARRASIEDRAIHLAVASGQSPIDSLESGLALVVAIREYAAGHDLELRERARQAPWFLRLADPRIVESCLEDAELGFACAQAAIAAGSEHPKAVEAVWKEFERAPDGVMVRANVLLRSDATAERLRLFCEREIADHRPPSRRTALELTGSEVSWVEPLLVRWIALPDARRPIVDAFHSKLVIRGCIGDALPVSAQVAWALLTSGPDDIRTSVARDAIDATGPTEDACSRVIALGRSAPSTARALRAPLRRCLDRTDDAIEPFLSAYFQSSTTTQASAPVTGPPDDFELEWLRDRRDVWKHRLPTTASFACAFIPKARAWLASRAAQSLESTRAREEDLSLWTRALQKGAERQRKADDSAGFTFRLEEPGDDASTHRERDELDARLVQLARERGCDASTPGE